MSLSQTGVVDMLLEMSTCSPADKKSADLAARIISKLIWEETEFRGRLYGALTNHLIATDAGVLIDRLGTLAQYPT